MSTIINKNQNRFMFLCFYFLKFIITNLKLSESIRLESATVTKSNAS